VSDVISEGFGRQIDQIAPLREANGPPSSLVHRDGTSGLNTADRLRRLQSVEMAPPKVGPPTSHRHQSDVDASRLRKSKLRTGVAGIPASAGAINEIAKRRSAMRASRVSPAIVIGCQDAYL
jgi:hypothetical protein